MKKYNDLPVDPADGTLVVLAESQGINEFFTLDHKDFKVYKISGRKKLKLLPSDL